LFITTGLISRASLEEYDYSTITKVKSNPVVRQLQELKKLAATKILFSGQKNVNDFMEKFGR
jgi:hypothetical protein